MHSWLASSLVRHYPSSHAVSRETLQVEMARGAQASFQVAFRIEDDTRVITAAAHAPGGLHVRVRRVGYVPVPHFNVHAPLHEIDGAGHIPGYVPDPLFPDAAIHAGPYETHAFWITVHAPAALAPGDYPVTVTLACEGVTEATHTAVVRVRAAVLPARRDFPVTHWFYTDALCHWYGTEVWREDFWPIVEPYVADVVAHGQDMLYVHVFTQPTDGVKRPTQLLKVTHDGDNYRFDWTLVRRWIDMAKRLGVTYFEWAHLFTQWGAKYALRIYEGHGETGRLLWDPETPAVSPTSYHFMQQFLPAFKRFMDEEGIFAQSYFHLSDEPHGEEHLRNYRAARALLRELAPWMRVMDALSEIDFAREGLCDIPIPIITNAPQFVAEGFRPWAYYCCGPRENYLNRLLDTTLVKIAMSGWIFYRTKVHGFLHWGYNYWYQSQTQHLIDPFTVLDGKAWPGWAYGDTHLVYPGADGPIDSLRWEVWAESLQDYALLQAAQVDPDDPTLAAIHDYAEFPRDERWILRRRRALLDMLDGVRV